MKAWISLPARLESVEAARQWLLSQLDGTALTDRARFRIELVLEELVMNVVRHGHPRAAAHDGFSFRLGVEVSADLVQLCLEDDGVPFDPATAPDAVPPATLAEARVGGLGLVLVHKSARSLRHERIGTLNRLWVDMPTRDAGS